MAHTGCVTPVPVKPCRLPALRNVPHAIPYQGSKRALAHAIVPLLPADTAVLAEPFAGSAAVTIAARHTRAARGAVISDINEPLMALWGRIIAEPAMLADDYEALWQAQRSDPRAFYDEVRAKFNATGEPHLLLYLLARCVKAAVRYGRNGAFNQSPDNRRLGAAPAAMRRRLARTAQVLAGTATMTGDYAERLLGAGERDVVYLDPPYQGVSSVRDHRYMRGLSRADFEDALRQAVRTDVSFIVSYDGVTGHHRYGEPLPADLGLTHLQVIAGRSTQATLHGRDTITVESLYLSPALVARLGGAAQVAARLGGAVPPPARSQP
jgi:DNA adenine methylase